MELAWIEDFLALSSTLNFTKAASMRNLTQPTFSRRIRNLELWMGATLVDRSTFPITLTDEGRGFRQVAQDVAQSLYRERDLARGVNRPKRAFLSLSMNQTIASDFFLTWLDTLEVALGSLRTNVIGASMHDCVQALAAESCDLMLCYSSAAGPLLLDGAQYPSVQVAEEYLLPVVAPDAGGRPLHDLDAEGARSIPYLGFSSYAYLGRLVTHILDAAPKPPPLDLCFESALAAGLKAMAVAGRGVAWLPHHAVKPELAAGQLVVAGAECWTMPLQIRAYRTASVKNRLVESLWSHLTNTAPLTCSPPMKTTESASRALTPRARPVHPGETQMPTRKMRGSARRS
ncbi:MAG TPA: LysR substrate-binding domain-containing protein [Acidocella sp.]|jgi:DNA-binding transcriptional LysR family regulator|uniref:LysR substrate-binding domain-containing protein n=1 Tax=Acidocella sp. TaxID=50710 RepID=UPI002BC5A5AC|nr:LysR substrate-binding domain-containing protein [Acidocella sp.]HVE22875.1 LysR substrate-binding domain-containing protein [Acidocella sp.]